MKIFAAMKILLVSATDMETAAFRNTYLSKVGSTVNGIQINFLTTGIGMLATAARLTSSLEQSVPDLIIQAGIAGSFSDSLALGSVCRVASEVIADMGVWENGDWKDVFDLGLVDNNMPPYNNSRLGSTEPGFLDLSHIPTVNAITVNEITTDPGRIEIYRQKYRPDIESMEGAALHFVGIENSIPFLQLRAVSNYIGERNKANWQIKESVSNLNDSLTVLVTQLVSDKIQINKL
ncbi:MAG: futalosine hydrolase [Chitinophagaceae bacterium]|nr:MAG: futalosine hydrolase [Chitinophagaceae bacterium]